MTQQEWSREVVSLIAKSVKRHRDARKMSAEKLAQACADVGFKIPRSVIANLESGRRETVSVPEWLTLAAALDVPPILLLYPLGQTRDKITALPGIDLTPWEAVKYVETGTRPLREQERGDDDEPTTQHDRTVYLFREHERVLRVWRRARRAAQEAVRLLNGGAPEPGIEVPDDPAELERDRLAQEAEIRRAQLWIAGIRHELRLMDLVLPDLPPGLRHLDGQDLLDLDRRMDEKYGPDRLRYAIGGP